MIEVAVKRLPHAMGLPLPGYATAGSAGLDLLAAIDDGESVILQPMARLGVPTGLMLHIPDGYEGQVRPRSGLARDHGVTVLNAPGTIDADYRGEITVLLVNLGAAPLPIIRGMRIAQLVIAPVTPVRLVETIDLAPSVRGSGGFGSTGL